MLAAMQETLNNKPERLKMINQLMAGVIFLTNIYFIPLSFSVIKSSGGPMGYGLLLLPILLLSNLLMIPAALTYFRKFKNSTLLLIVNGTGLIWNLFWLYLFVTVP